MACVLADTGPLVAAFNKHDEHHAWALARMGEFRTALRAPAPVLSEVCFLLSDMTRSLSAFMEFWKRGHLCCEFDVEAEKNAVCSLMAKYRNQPISLADACLIRMTEIQSDAVVWTLDRDFLIYRRLGRQVIPCIAPWKSA